VAAFGSNVRLNCTSGNHLTQGETDALGDGTQTSATVAADDGFDGV
jgi:hypothetical protein